MGLRLHLLDCLEWRDEHLSEEGATTCKHHIVGRSTVHYTVGESAILLLLSPLHYPEGARA